jgi:hypothetical protein
LAGESPQLWSVRQLHKALDREAVTDNSGHDFANGPIEKISVALGGASEMRPLASGHSRRAATRYREPGLETAVVAHGER